MKVVYIGHKKRLKNKKPTIISSDCVGGIIYNNLGLEFKSPTINLHFSKDDFFEFVCDLKNYLSCELLEVIDSGKPYPVGKLTNGNKTILVNFTHYNSFNEAKEKWNNRKKRIDFSNIYIIQILPKASAEDINIFDSLPYENKMLITANNPTGSKNVVLHDIFLKHDYHSGEILEYKTKFSPKRFIDDVDYVSFLNSNYRISQ